MGIIINFTAHTVQGFGLPGMDYPVMIEAANDTKITFRGDKKFGEDSESVTWGSIDRVTGDVSAIVNGTDYSKDNMTRQIRFETVYALQCRPTQRMF